MGNNNLPPMVEEQQQPWGKRQVEDYREIVLKAVEKCREEGSKQMIQGMSNVAIYNEEAKSWEKVDLSDQRKIFREAVNTLYDLLLFYFDEKATNKLESIEDAKTEIFRDLFKRYILIEKDPKHRRRAEEVQTFTTSQTGKFFENIWETRLHELDRQRFRELLLLFKRKNDLKGKRQIGPY